MNKKVVLININKLRSHEKIDHNHLEELILKIKQDGLLKNPVVVDDKYFIILDGHHRVRALKRLKVNFIPAYLVNYQQNSVRVFLRRKLKLTKPIKEMVIENSLASKLFLSKTTRHFIKYRPKNINIPLHKLQLST